MKPVQLLPSDQRAALGEPSDRPIAGMLLAGIGIFTLVGGYFGYSHVSGVRVETENLRTQASQATAQEASTRAKIAELGERTSYANLASTSEQAVLTSLTQRFIYSRLLTSINNVVPAGSLWIDEMNVAAGGGGGTGTVTGISMAGNAVDEVTITAFTQRLSAVGGLTGVLLESVSAAQTTDGDVVQTFTIRASIDSSAFVATSTGANDPLVSDGGGSGATSVSLDPVPKSDMPAPAPKPDPKPEPAPEPKSSLEMMAESVESSTAGGAK